MDIEEAATFVKLTDTADRRDAVGESCIFFYLLIFNMNVFYSPPPIYSYLMPLMDIAVKFHSWMPFCGISLNFSHYSFLLIMVT